MNARPELPAGHSRDHLRLWTKQYRLLWDSATATTPAYQHINTWVNATIDHPDGTRWSGQFYRSPEGIQRWCSDDLTYLTWPDNPLFDGGD